MTPTLKFDQAAADQANQDWGLNCGPSALAAILNLTLDEVRGPCEKVSFASRGYMNVSMMMDAIKLAGGQIAARYTPARDHWPKAGLVRIQWTGPWIIDGKPARWAATATHWIAHWQNAGSLYEPVVFDINGGLLYRDQWLEHVVPAIISSIKRADGGWYITHSWEIRK